MKVKTRLHEPITFLFLVPFHIKTWKLKINFKIKFLFYSFRSLEFHGWKWFVQTALISFFFQNEVIFLKLDELNELDKITNA